MTVSSIFQGIRTLGFFPLVRTLSEANAQVTRSLKPLPPRYSEDYVLWQTNIPRNVPDTYTIGYHGTSLRCVEAQIKQGFFENRAAQLSFWERGYLLKRTGGLYVTPYIHDASTFAFTSDDGDQAVVLGIYYNQAKARSDGNFGTKYLLPGEGDERVYPIAVYGVDPEYIEAMKPENRHQYMLSLRERLRRVHEIASQRWPKSDLIPRN